MKALPSIAFNEFKGSLSSFYAFIIKDTGTGCVSQQAFKNLKVL